MINLYDLKHRLKNSKLANDSLWAIFGNVLGKGLSLLTAILVARILGKEVYGELGIVGGTIGSILIFSNFGINFTATKYIAENNASRSELLAQIVRTCLRISTVLSGIASILLFFMSEHIAIYVLKSPSLTLPLRLLAINVLIGSLCRTQVGILAGLGKFKDLAIINAYVGIATFLSSVILTYFYNLIGALIALIVVQILNFFLNRYFIRKHIDSKSIRTEKKISLNEIIKFSVPVALQEAFYSIITYSFGLLLVRFSTYGEVGLNAAAVYWSAIILFIPGILRNVILSHLSANLDHDQKRHRILKTILLFNFCVTAMLSLIIYALSDFIVSTYGDDFLGLKDIINISVFTTIFVSMSNVYAQAYMSENKNWIMLMFRILRDGSILVISYFLIVKNNGVNGALSLATSSLWANILFLILMGVVYEFKIKRTRV
ncbi:oligosaccharide flippase family protein [Flagellimonas flava]|uniref:Membrane protein involved in the export of O-antigen and teichoic acid n=1 Tax=Flagellimonas flava TaxID=570519 RepID=A0A1M5J628_9FLAO|nr:oligosaccharide flippase family protein [Allomuricauda flava]SHG36076.1 Membrane protein involved in the export of O-antigen and teichoic acid [Allomuricauda flava]